MKVQAPATTHKLARKIYVWVVSFSFIVMCIATGVAVYVENKLELTIIDDRIEQVRVINTDSLSASLWGLDEPQIQTVMAGILQLPDIEYLSLQSDDIKTIELGQRPQGQSIKRTIPLQFNDDGTMLHLGDLTIIAGLEEAHNRLVEKLGATILSEAILIFLTSAFIIFIINYLVTRHLIRIAAFCREIEFDKYRGRLRLNRKGHSDNRNDELDVLLTAFNTMLDDLRSSHDALENKVRERTVELEEARNEADRANNAKSEFLSSMSHDLRTPLNAILGFTQLMKFDERNEDDEESLDAISKAGAHLLNLVDEVLDLAKIESGTFNLSIEKVLMSQLMDECLTFIDSMATDHGIEIINEIKESDTIVQADYTRLKQVILNLLSNAVKYNSEHGRINLKSEVVDDAFLRIWVNDTGNGLTKEQISKIFVPFERAGAEATEIEGTGIGLVITKRLIESMGGEIGVESEPGIGSQFWVTIPLAEGLLSDLYLQEEIVGETTESSNIPLAGKNSKVIIYIEDNPANIALVKQVIDKHTNHHLLEARDVESALELTASSHPDIILMDINLPGMSGLEAMHQLRQDTNTMTIPVIAVSANAMPEDIAKAKPLGFKYYLTKPIDIDELLHAIESV